MIVVNHREIPAGLVVDEVLGFRRFAEREFTAEAPPTMIRCEHYLAGSFRRGSEAWPVLSLGRWSKARRSCTARIEARGGKGPEHGELA